MMSEFVRSVVDKVEKGEKPTDEEVKKLGEILMEATKGMRTFNVFKLSSVLGIDEAKIIKLYALICSRDEFREQHGCKIFNEFLATPPRRGRKQLEGEDVVMAEETSSTQQPSEEPLQKSPGPEYSEKEIATGGINFDQLQRAFVLHRGVVFVPDVYVLYNLLKRTKVKLRKDDGSITQTSLLNLTIGAPPDLNIGFMSWVNNVILKFYEMLGISPAVLLFKFKDQFNALLTAQGMELVDVPDYIKTGLVSVKVRGRREGHLKVAVESKLEEAEASE